MQDEVFPLNLVMKNVSSS